MPETHLAVSQLAIGKLQHDAAYVFVGKVVSPAEPETVEGADGIKEERIASPAGKEKVTPGFRRQQVREAPRSCRGEAVAGRPVAPSGSGDRARGRFLFAGCL